MFSISNLEHIIVKCYYTSILLDKIILFSKNNN